MGRSRKCGVDGCDRFAKHSVDGVYKYCISHMRVHGLIPKDSPKKRLGGSSPDMARSSESPQCDAVASTSDSHRSSTCDKDFAEGSRQQQMEASSSIDRATAPVKGNSSALESSLLDVVQTLCKMSERAQVAAADQSSEPAKAASADHRSHTAEPAAEAQQVSSSPSHSYDSAQPQEPSYLGPNTTGSEDAGGASRHIAGKRYPQVYEDDCTPIIRKGSHKGRVCAHHGCEKFARLSTGGVRKYCIAHMRSHGLVPKDYAKRGGMPGDLSIVPLKHNTSSSLDAEDAEPAAGAVHEADHQQHATAAAAATARALQLPSSFDLPHVTAPPPAPARAGMPLVPGWLCSAGSGSTATLTTEPALESLACSPSRAHSLFQSPNEASNILAMAAAISNQPLPAQQQAQQQAASHSALKRNLSSSMLCDDMAAAAAAKKLRLSGSASTASLAVDQGTMHLAAALGLEPSAINQIQGALECLEQLRVQQQLKQLLAVQTAKTEALLASYARSLQQQPAGASQAPLAAHEDVASQQTDAALMNSLLLQLARQQQQQELQQQQISPELAFLMLQKQQQQQQAHLPLSLLQQGAGTGAGLPQLGSLTQMTQAFNSGSAGAGRLLSGAALEAELQGLMPMLMGSGAGADLSGLRARGAMMPWLATSC